MFPDDFLRFYSEVCCCTVKKWSMICMITLLGAKL